MVRTLLLLFEHILACIIGWCFLGFGIRNPSISGMPGDRFFGDIPTLIESYNTESINNDMKTECAKW